MQDKQYKEIVDSQGNAYKSNKDKNKITQYLETNIWNFLGTGLAAVITLAGIVNFVISKSFSASCANFYGIDKKYFSGTEMFEDKLIFILCAFVMFVYPIILATVYKGNIIKNLIMDCQSYTKYRPNETTGGIFVSWRRKEELPTGA